MFVNFYDKNNKCLFSVEVNSEKQGEDLADKVYQKYLLVNDYTITRQSKSKKIKIF